MKNWLLTAFLIAIMISLPLSRTQSFDGTSLVNANSVSPSIAPTIEWEHTYSTADSSDLQAMIQTSDGGYAMAGLGMELAIGDIGFWLLKVDSSGNKTWDQVYTAYYFNKEMNVNYGGAHSIVQTLNGGYTLAGGNYLIKTDSLGNVEWREDYGGGVEVLSLVNTSDGGLAMAGIINGDCWLATVNSTGELQWSRTYANETVSLGLSMIQTNDGDYAIAGVADSLLIKTDSLGNILLNQSYNGAPSDFQPDSLIETNSGDFVLAGSVSAGVCMIKTDSGGNMLWTQTYSELGGEAASSVIQTSDGGYALACGNYSSGNLVKTDSGGNLEWYMNCSSAPESVVQTNDGGYALAGNSWLAKTDAGISIPPLTTTVPATRENGSTVDLAISGNITNSQMSNVTIAADQSADSTTVSFTLTGENNTTGFSNITIPINAVPDGTTPTIYIDGHPAQNQGYTQDGSNYYVWYSTHFSTHQITILFTAKSSVPELTSSIVLALFIMYAVSVVVVLALRKTQGKLKYRF